MSARQSPLREAHAEQGARFTEFGGWAMPVEFDSIREEHAAVRDTVGKFDVSHMGQIEIEGPDATELTQRLTTNDVTELGPGDAQYAAVLNEEGVMRDDTVVYRWPDVEEQPAYLFVPNAGNDADACDRWTRYRDEWELDATVRNATDAYGMIAVQGPNAAATVVDAISDGTDPGAIDRFEATTATVDGVDCWLARTGYTGEDGFELFAAVGDIETVWRATDCQPCGLGTRDTLRIEMGFLLSGQDFHPSTEPHTPTEAGIGFVVDRDTEFVGRDALLTAELRDRFVGLYLLDRCVPREGYSIIGAEGSPIGRVTSGTMSPTLDEPVALGYVRPDHADPGTRVHVDVRGSEKRATVVAPPFVGDDGVNIAAVEGER